MGNPQMIRFRENASQLFPELSHHPGVTRLNGKFGIEACTRDLPITVALGCAIEHVVFLNRKGTVAAELMPGHPIKAINWCLRYAKWGDDQFRSHQADTYRRLAGSGIWQLNYRDLDSAVARLKRLADTGQ
jgi:hypothetical protein